MWRLYGGAGTDMDSRSRRRGEDVEYQLEVSLEDLFLGTTKRLSHSRNVICRNCSGEGSKFGDSVKCEGCRGSGVIVAIRPVGPSSQPFQVQSCPECMGTGEVINFDDCCAECRGRKVVPAKYVLIVDVEKGMQDGQKIIYPGLAHEEPETTAGDFVIVIQQRKHPEFTRKGDDLFYEHTLTLAEALLGFRFVLRHLDGRKLLIKSRPGEVVRHDSYKAIDDEGMPAYEMPSMRGKLYIHFNVEFPSSLSQEQAGLISDQRLADELRALEIDECEETILHSVNIEEEMQQRQAQALRQEAYDEDDEVHEPVQCAQQ